MINPMTPRMAITTARQMYQMLYGLDVTESMFVDMVAPEIYGAAKMENLAAQNEAKSFCEGECPELVHRLSSRYEVPSQLSTQPAVQPEQQQTEETRVVLATEEDMQSLLA